MDASRSGKERSRSFRRVYQGELWYDAKDMSSICNWEIRIDKTEEVPEKIILMIIFKNLSGSKIIL